MDIIVSDNAMIRDLKYKEVIGDKGKKKWRVLLLLPGGKAGVWQAGFLHGLCDAGVAAQHFDAIVAISCGSWNALAYRAGKAHLVRDEYINLTLVDLGRLVARMREMGLEDVKASSPKVYIGVSDLFGNLRLYDADQEHSMLDLCMGSSSNLFPVMRGSELVIDGGYAHPCPVARIVRDARSKAQASEIDILAVSPRAHPRHLATWDDMLYQAFVRTWLPWFSWSLCASALDMGEKMERAAEMATKRRKRIRFGIAFPSALQSIHPLEMRSSVVRDAGVAGYESGRMLLEKHRY